MIRKLIIILAIAFAVTVIADYYGVITLPSLEKPTVLGNRYKMKHKTKGALESERF
ncbi:MAG: hypothetical protein V3S72_09505 [Desulfobacterales bacterium]